MANGPVLVVDFGAQSPSSSPAARVREAGVYLELVPHSMTVRRILAKDSAIILSDGPASVFGARRADRTIDTWVFRIRCSGALGICGFQVMAYGLAARWIRPRSAIRQDLSHHRRRIRRGISPTPAEQTVLDEATRCSSQTGAQPASVGAGPHRRRAPYAMADESRKLYGVQGNCAEVNAPLGRELIERASCTVAAALPNDWDASSIIGGSS